MNVYFLKFQNILFNPDMDTLSKIENHSIKVGAWIMCIPLLTLKNKMYFLQIAKEVLKLDQYTECSIEALGDGLNFMSDAYFVKVKDNEDELNLFVKVCHGKCKR